MAHKSSPPPVTTWRVIPRAEVRQGGPPLASKPKLPFDPKVFLAEADGGSTVSQCRKSQIVFSQGDLADSVFYIIAGSIKLSVVSEHGKEAVVAILGADEFCGEGSLAGQSLRVATARAM